MFENYKVFETTLAGRPLIVETGKVAQLANGSCLVRWGDTVVMCAAAASSKPRDGIDFFPLSVDFEEKLYSVGKIPGSFMKREGRPSERAILASRLIDRPMRPLFPKDMRNDVSLVCTVMSVEQDNLPEIAAMIGASIAVSISDIPWNGPIGCVIMGLVDGEIVCCPTEEQRKTSQMAVTVAASADKVVMIEAAANQVDEDIVIDSIRLAHDEIKKTVAFINDIKAQIGKSDFEYPSMSVPDDMFAKVKEFAYDGTSKALENVDKTIRDKMMGEVTAAVEAHFAEEYPDMKAQLGECLYQLQKKIVRHWLIDEQKRVDGRGIDEIRPLAAEVGILPRVHGSGMFTRGQTQVLTIATLGTVAEQQLLDGIDPEEHKRYMHHYNFPSYSVGETRPSRGPGRREIGHGALAERALDPVIPSVEEFPYSLRLVSEVLSSNGSTSQGAICGSTLALMDAGVPIKAPVAGISCGLITDEDRWLTMIDIQGLEDFFGDMDFKVAGSHKGITAIQMDLKIDGLTHDMVRQAIYQTRDARYHILDDIMLKCIPEPHQELSRYAPKMITITINPDKIRDVIGKGGSVIQKIVADTGAKVDIEDDGRIFIAAIDQEAGNKALEIINAIVFEPTVGAIYNGKVTRIIPIGAFVEFAPGKEGLVHISKLENRRVERVEDILSVGDDCPVKFMGMDEKGRMNLSRKDALPAQ